MSLKERWMIGCLDVMFVKMYAPGINFLNLHEEPLFNPHPELLKMTSNDWKELTLETFKEVFKDSAVKRTKFEGLSRNINFLKEIN